jgi:hypothetical protein
MPLSTGSFAPAIPKRKPSSALVETSNTTNSETRYVPYPEPGGLLEWARSNCGDSFYWRTWSEAPADWSVVVSGANDDWSEYAMGAVDFLAAVYRRDLKIPGMPEDFPTADPDLVAVQPQSSASD